MNPSNVRKTTAEKADTTTKVSRVNKRGKVARTRYPPVVVCTGLPPLVDGQIRCFLKLTIRRIRLVLPEPHSQHDYVVRVKWWGEPSDGAYFKPICGRKTAGRQITARFAVRCGPKQFAAYMMDAGALSLELLQEGSTDKVLAVANVTEIVSLSVQTPIIGWYKMLSIPNHKHLADVHVSMSFCELQDIYGESSGTGTGTEMSQDESDVDSPAMKNVKTYKVEKGFVESTGGPSVKFSDSQPVISNERKDEKYLSEVDRLIERAELLKMLISPDIHPTSRLTPNFDFDADASLSDASLIADIFYRRSKEDSSTDTKVDTAVQVARGSPKKTILRSPVASPIQSPAVDFVSTRGPTPKGVRFFDHEMKKRSDTKGLKSALKNVHRALVHVHKIRFSPGDYRQFVAGSIPRRSLPGISTSLSKPPRPLKVTFFVHAQLPTGELFQLTRICGKSDLESPIIDFEQAEIQSLTLNDSRISLWLESAAITFRVSCRHAGVNRTQPVGIAVFNLEPLLLSENFKSRQNVALSTRNPGSTIEMAVELQLNPNLEINNTLKDEELNQTQQSVGEKSPKKMQAVEIPPTPKAIPLVVMFYANDIEFTPNFVERVSAASSVAKLGDRWEVYLTAAAFSQPRRSSTKRSLTVKPPKASVSPKFQLFYVYPLEDDVVSKFEDNHMIVELRRHIPNDEDQLLAICKVSLHQVCLIITC